MLSRAALDSVGLQQPPTAAADFDLLGRLENYLARSTCISHNGQVFEAIRPAGIGRKEPERLFIRTGRASAHRVGHWLSHDGAGFNDFTDYLSVLRFHDPLAARRDRDL